LTDNDVSMSLDEINK